MKMKYLKSNRGFTLLEVVTSIALFSFLLISVFQFYSNQQELMAYEIQKQDTKTHARTVMNRIFIELSYATNLKVDENLNMVVMVSEEGNLIPIIDFTGYTERGRLNYLTGEKHDMIVNEKSEIISDQIDDFSITYQDDKISISVTVNDKKNKPYTLKRDFYLHKL